MATIRKSIDGVDQRFDSVDTYSYAPVVVANPGNPDIADMPISTVSTTSATGAGSTTAGALRVSIANVGAVDATVDGQSFPADVAITYTLDGFKLPSISYDATGTILLITEIGK